MTAEQRRTAVRTMVETALRWETPISERHACTVLGVPRATVRYHGRRGDNSVLRARLRHHAAARRRWGYRRLLVLLRREGWTVNAKCVHRLYRAEGLAVRRRVKKRVARERAPLPAPTRPNEQWSLDFVSDTLADGRRFRALTIVDAFTRECPAIEVDTSLPGERVVRVLERLRGTRGLPDRITVDNGPELAGKALDIWAHQRGVTLEFITPGRPVENAFIESFNARFRDECLNENWFLSLSDARFHIERYRRDYNEVRPHSSLAMLTPTEFSSLFDQQHDQPDIPFTPTPGLSFQVG